MSASLVFTVVGTLSLSKILGPLSVADALAVTMSGATSSCGTATPAASPTQATNAPAPTVSAPTASSPQNQVPGQPAWVLVSPSGVVNTYLGAMQESLLDKAFTDAIKGT